MCRCIGGGKCLDLLGQVGQLRTLGSFFSLRRFVVGGEGGGLLVQGVELSLNDVETLALRRFLSLYRRIGGGKRLDLLRQVSQLGTLGGFFRPRRFIIGGEGCGLLVQGIELPLNDVETLALRRFLALSRCISGSKRLDLLRQVS